ncbi:nucleobase:cation symporter-2 family protein [Pseudokineococcus sp. 1T1Z-3]|uniref:nucleobase:cation symporter-2 family protein n=1 Tax=Pseudokineococcus sp. 1T1Z-3 TaxID=3132745 RepID=UPI00309F77D1
MAIGRSTRRGKGSQAAGAAAEPPEEVTDTGATTAADADGAVDQLVYGLDDRPPLPAALLAAVQHLLAIFVGIVTPTLILAGPLGLDAATTTYLVSMSLVVSGVATFIQVRRFGPVGSGLLSIQGTSFAFLGPLGAAGAALGGGTAALGTLFGMTFVGSFLQMALSRVMHLLKRVITPIVTGTVVTLIGLSLIGSGMTDAAGGAAAEDFGSLRNLGLAGLVLATIVLVNRASNRFLRMSAIVIGLVVGYVVAAVMGMVDLSGVGDAPVFSVPIPFRYGFDFDLALFIPIAFIFLISAVETTGDLTATSMVSGQPVKGPTYIRRIKGGVLGDGVNSALAAVLNSFPNTTFSQNNGVIQLTGMASRFVGMILAGMLVLVGLFPIIPAVVTAIPRPVLGGATIVLFGTVAAAGIKIISTSDDKLDRRDVLILAVSLALGLGVRLVPDALSGLPTTAATIFSSPITTGGLAALVLNLVLPRSDGTHGMRPREGGGATA